MSKRLFAAVMAAVASVTFTSAGTATLGAAAFTLAGFQAAGEEAGTTTTASVQQNLSGDYEIAEESANIELTKAAGPTAEEKEAEDKLNEELEDNARLVKEKEEAEKNERTTVPLDKEALKRALDNVNRSSVSGSGYMSAVLAGDPVETETASPQAAPAQQDTTVATGTLPSNDLGFTTDVNGNTAASLAKAAVASPAPALMGAAPAADNEQTSLDLEDTAETASTVQTDTLPTAQPAYNGYYGGIYTGPSIRPMAKSAASTPLLGAVEEEPATTGEPDPTPGYANVITTTFENANQASIGRVTLRNTFTSAAGGTVPVGGITSLKDASGANLGVKMNGTAGSDATFLSPNADVQNNPWTMVMTFSGAEVVQSIDGITLSVGLFTADGNWLPRTVSMNGDVTFTATVAAAVGGTGVSYDFTGSLFGGQEGPHHGQGADKFTVNLTGEALNLNAAVTDATITLTLTSTLDHSCYVGLQDIQYNVTTVPYTEHDLFWKGGAGEWNKNPETKNWNIVSGGGSYQAVAFEDGSNIFFYQPGVSSLNITEQALEAGNVFVDHGVHVQLSAVDGALLTAKNVDVLGDITVTDVAINADTLNIEEGSTVTANTTGDRVGYLTPNLFGDGTFVKDGAGTLWLAGDNTDFEGNFVIKGGKLVIPQSETGALGLGVNPDVTLAGEGAELAGTINATGRDIRITSTADGTVSANISAPEQATLTFDTHEGSTLTASGTLAGNIYKDGDGTLKLTGDNSGATGEFFIYQGRVEATDAAKSIGNGTVHVDSSATLALTAEGGGYHIKDLDVTYGGNLEVAYVSKNDATDSKILQLDHMFLHSSSYVDFSQVTLEAPASGSNKYYVAKYTTADWTEGDSVTAEKYTTGLVQFITMSGLKYGGENGLRADNIVSLWIEGSPEGEGRLYLQVDAPQPGFYWNGRDTENPLVWDIQTSKNWSTDYGLTNDVVFVNSDHDLGSHAVRSAYFLKPTGETPQTITMTDDQFEVQNLIIGNGVDKTDYKFQAEESATINMDSDRMANLIVHKNATASFDKVYIGMDKHSLLQVEEGAELRVTNAPFSMYSITNAGKVDVSATTLYLEDLLAHVTNAGDFKVIWEDTSWGSNVQLGDIANGGTMTLGASTLGTSLQYGEQKVLMNDGTLIIDSDRPEGEDPTHEVQLYMPVQGFGGMETQGSYTVRLSKMGGDGAFFATSTALVNQNSLTLGAATSIFEEAVELASFTTVKKGSEAFFYGGNTTNEEAGPGSFGALTLEDGTEGDQTKLSLGGYYHEDPVVEWYWDEQVQDFNSRIISEGGEQYDTTYAAGPVTAGENTVFTVENGAHATIESYNAEAEERRGTIVVGAETSQDFQLYTPEYADATLTVDGKTNVKELTVHKGTETPDNVTVDLRGAANVGHLTQDGGTVHFRENSFLDTGNVSGGVMSIKPDHVLTLGHVITETGNYTVENNDGVGIAGYIDASNLDLVTDTTHSTYREVKYEGETTRFQSGFISSGRQYVQVFDVQGGTLTGNDTIIYHKDAAGVMHLISGSDKTETEKGPYYDGEGGGGFAGYGYLEIEDTQYLTYYVRDNYVSGNQDGRTDTHETKVDPRPANQVKLSEIITASIVAEEPLLQSVVFDQTDYNKNSVVGESNFNGTLTVDVSTKADLFSVTDGTLAALNINDPVNPETEVVVLADQDYQGVQGTLKIAGTDVYRIDNRGDLGTNVSLLKDDTDGVAHWTGTVRLTGTAEDVYMPDLSVNEGEAASTIEFNQWTGTFKEGAQTSNGKIVLVGDDFLATQSAAITFAETEHDTTTDLTWTNTVTGDRASVTHLNDGNLNLTMTGDTSAWTGHFLQGADGTNVNLTFNLDDSAGTATREQNTEIWSASGDMTVTYGGDLETVGANVHVYDDSAKLTLVYTADELAVTGIIAQQNGQGDLHLVVGDGENESVTTFSGLFAETEGADMTVKKGSTAIIDTDAPLLWVRGEEGSTVQVTTGNTLTLTSQDPENSYSRFYDLDNQGTIKMEGNGGDIKLVDLNGNKTYELGDLQIVNGPGTAAIETSSVDNTTTTVNITNLSSPATDQTLKLMNDNGHGTVAYNLGGDTNFAGGTIQFGSNEDSGSANVVLKSETVAANAVLQSTGTSTDKADVVVATAEAQVLGIDSTTDSTVGGSVYGIKDVSTDPNSKLTITGDGTYSYNGALGGDLDIAYTGDGKQTFEGGADNFNGAVTVKSGSTESGILALQNASEVQITDLLIGANDTLEVKNGETNGVAYVSGTLTAEGGPTTEGSGSASKLNGDLTLNNGATYDVSAAGGTGGLDLGGALTITPGALMSDNDMPAIFGMKIGDRYDLAFDVTSFNGFEEELSIELGNAIDASTLFGGNQFWEGEYYVCYSGAGLNGGNGSNVGTVYLYKATPEPTTGTLSLLALAALAARRRRR